MSIDNKLDSIGLDITFSHEDTPYPVSVCSDKEGVEVSGLPFLPTLDAITAHCKSNNISWESVLDEVPLHIISAYLEMCNE